MILMIETEEEKKRVYTTYVFIIMYEFEFHARQVSQCLDLGLPKRFMGLGEANEILHCRLHSRSPRIWRMYQYSELVVQSQIAFKEIFLVRSDLLGVLW